MLEGIKADIKSDKRYFQRKREYYKLHREDVQAVADELKLGETPTRAVATDDSIDLSVSGTLVELKECFRAFRKLGYEPNDRPEDPKLASFNTVFTHPDKKVRFWLFFTSTVCTRKKVGTEMVERDVYEVVCE